jgi:ribosome assembly protein RRB1
MDVDEVLPPVEEEEKSTEALSVFLPGKYTLGKDEILEPDESVYIMRHAMNVNWPCLSFAVLRDNLGDQRQRYPATAYVVAGSQADTPSNNEITVYKMSSLYKTQRDGGVWLYSFLPKQGREIPSFADDSASESEEESDGENLDEDAALEFRSVPHHGAVNRVRAQPMPPFQPLPPVSNPYHVASWSETGKVHIWDVRPLIESLDMPGFTVDKSRTHKPVFTINSHGNAEGFAMDWASSGETRPSGLRLLTGDIHSKIYLTTTSPAGFNALSQPFTSHTSSVEDLQWSPSEFPVFASCSADQSVRIWDVRIKGRKSVAGIETAHDSDVNVISWNTITNYLLLSGGDEGGIKVWDLRNVKRKGSVSIRLTCHYSSCRRTASSTSTPVASFNWHNGPITSVEWHPTEDSIFAASGDDNQVTLWDLAVEEDDEESSDMKETQQQGVKDVPPQLLFVHQGQANVKEVHWHPQIPGAVISTAYDGFNIFKTISV